MRSVRETKRYGETVTESRWILEEAGLPDTVGNMQAALRLLDGETALDTVLELARESRSEQDVVGQLASETANAAVLETAMDHVVPQEWLQVRRHPRKRRLQSVDVI